MLVTGIYLQRAGGGRPTPDQWEQGFGLLNGEFDRYSIKAGYCMIDNYLGALKLRKFDGRLPSREDFSRVDTISLAATPPGLGEPGWNWLAICGLSYLEGFDRLSLDFLLDHRFCELGGREFRATLRSLLTFSEWDFGWAMAREKERGIGIYLGGVGGGDGLDQEDDRRTDLWYNVRDGDERRTRIRDIFPYNIVASGHLQHAISSDRTLRDFIDADPDSELSPLTDKLWLWSVAVGRTEAVRAKLRGTGVIVTE